MRPGLRRKLNPFIEPDFVAERVEKIKAGIRAQVAHPFRVIERPFGFTQVRYCGLAKNTAQLVTLFALSSLWMARSIPISSATSKRVLTSRARASAADPTAWQAWPGRRVTSLANQPLIPIASDADLFVRPESG